MLHVYACHNETLRQVEPDHQEPAIVWYDLLSPTPEEDRAVEQAAGIAIPSRDEMEEIELSSRLYQEEGAVFMTLTALAQLDTDEPLKTPVTFILTSRALVTVRYADPRPFEAYCLRAARGNAGACNSGEAVMMGLIEAMSDRIADALEKASNDVDKLSREVFRKTSNNARRNTRNLQSVIEQIGRRSETLTMIQEALVSMGRLVAYHGALERAANGSKSSIRQMAKLIQRDAASLNEYAESLSDRLTFLLDATLGLINLEQNGIIKIFSVAAVVFLPPTLVASIYGMNFEHMPELGWQFGYPWAIGLMVLSAVLPYLFFKRKGWL
ncbi:magnesium transport protein CorA [Devosia pacifica]|uniref:Magnesium transport protein CorA n=1 Tax=Devosia pacifica TaxID=1335967 RepID=A0A918SDZ1_9HYPH|nr:magnesium transporter CorA family protein [Devosia pacifica]GHA36661.1 magnesium transport protein CorA [Devosia pacifica]